VPPNNLHVMLNALEGRLRTGPPPQSEVQSDGTFLINSVMPGRWRLHVNGMPGYVKSVQQGGEEASPWDLEIGPSGSQLKVVVGTKYVQVEATLSASTAASEEAAGTLWAAGGDQGFLQNFRINAQNSSAIRVPPGKYHVCAFATTQPWMLMQDHTLRKALESRCETVDAPEGGGVRVQLPVIPVADLKQILEKIEE
jgi:hypothetical protein